MKSVTYREHHAKSQAGTWFSSKAGATLIHSGWFHSNLCTFRLRL